MGTDFLCLDRYGARLKREKAVMAAASAERLRNAPKHRPECLDFRVVEGSTDDSYISSLSVPYLGMAGSSA